MFDQNTTCLEKGLIVSKRKRRPTGTPDPDAEVVSLSPKTLLESDKFICEICNQRFQRDQNLQMHKRRHKVAWKLLKRETSQVKKRVFVCPETSCLHHDPSHALGDLVGIKKHYRRKHSKNKKWVCEKCRRGYAVQSDFKAHLKTCGTRGHSCDCGRVFSRVESFIEHQDVCVQTEIVTTPQQPATRSSGTLSIASPSTDKNFSITTTNPPMLLKPLLNKNKTLVSTNLNLSIGSSEKPTIQNQQLESTTQKLKEEAFKQMNLAMAEKALALEARQEAKRQLEIAQMEFVNAKRLRHQAQSEVEKTRLLKDQATRKISTTVLQITCQACKQIFYTSTSNSYSSSLMGNYSEEGSFAMSYVSSALTEGDGDR